MPFDPCASPLTIKLKDPGRTFEAETELKLTKSNVREVRCRARGTVVSCVWPWRGYKCSTVAVVMGYRGVVRARAANRQDFSQLVAHLQQAGTFSYARNLLLACFPALPTLARTKKPLTKSDRWLADANSPEPGARSVTALLLLALLRLS